MSSFNPLRQLLFIFSLEISEKYIYFINLILLNMKLIEKKITYNINIRDLTVS